MLVLKQTQSQAQIQETSIGNQMENSQPLHLCHVSKLSILINRTHGLLHSIALSFLIYYRASYLFQDPETRNTPFLLWLLVFASELLLSFLWLLGQAYQWHPVSRTVFPERLPENHKLPSIDVFICTADPEKEPTIDVMNTVLSAMALNYPPDKLHVYLSDDRGAAVTLCSMRQAWRFARHWLPFCKKYNIKTICPKAYFDAQEEDDPCLFTDEFMEERQTIQQKYKIFQECVTNFREDQETNIRNARHLPAVIEVIDESPIEKDQEAAAMPLLVYVSREKNPSYHHNFKAGALNVLLRVSGMMSNSPYILVLDCDMYCNDPTSARQAMCFHFDSKLSSKLAFVQFPQKFHNISKMDIYDSQMRTTWGILWPGMDGLRGPVLSGCCFYIKRESLYSSSIKKGGDLTILRSIFGSSNEFIKSLQQDPKAKAIAGEIHSRTSLQNEAKIVASCSYESQTKWGGEVGFLYQSVAEDVITGLALHCKGLISVYLDPPRPQFLGTSVTSLSDLLIQGTRWNSGMLDIGLSKFCPLTYRPPKMSFLESMCYAEMSFFAFVYCLSLWCFGTIPQLCLLNGISLYPEVSSPFFLVYSYIFLSALSKHLYEVLKTGGSVQTWRNEQRLWMMKSVSMHTFGSLDAILKRAGLRKASFLPTNKVEDGEKSKLYQMGKFDFQVPPMLLAPMVTVLILNVASFFGGLIRTVFVAGDWDKMLVQVSMLFYVLVMNYAIIEGMMMRKDKGRIPLSVTIFSAVLAAIFLSLGSFVLLMFY